MVPCSHALYFVWYIVQIGLSDNPNVLKEVEEKSESVRKIEVEERSIN